MTELCAICGEGRAAPVSEIVPDREGRMRPLYFRVCDTCGSEYAGQAESNRNKIAREVQA